MTSSPSPLESSSLELSPPESDLLESSSLELTPLEQHRQQFPALANKVYFNYGGQGTMPQSAIAALLNAHEHIQQVGPFSTAINDWVTEEINQMRETIAVELNTDPETIALTEDASVGCNIAMWGIDWQTGDHLLLSDCEHPGIIAAALEIQRRFGAEVTFCPLMATLNDGDPVTIITQNLRPTTRLVVVSHILWNTGQVLPIAAIARACHSYRTPKKPVRLLVDAAQSVGVIPLNLSRLGADFYAFTGHKWWCGPAGLGGLYIHPEALSSLSPTFIGWRSVKKNASGYPIGWMPNSSRFEVATSDFALLSSLREAIALQNQWGSASERFQRIQALSLDLWQKLSNLTDITCLRSTPPEAGLVSFKVDRPGAGIHSRLVQELEQQSIFLRTIQDPECVRACVHYLTLESEIDQLVEAIQKFE